MRCSPALRTRRACANGHSERPVAFRAARAIANACRAYGVRAIDGPFTDFGDAERRSAPGHRARQRWASRASGPSIPRRWRSPTRSSRPRPATGRADEGVPGTLEAAACAGQRGLSARRGADRPGPRQACAPLQQRQAVIDRHIGRQRRSARGCETSTAPLAAFACSTSRPSWPRPSPAGTILADFGADVIKIEQARGRRSAARSSARPPTAATPWRGSARRAASAS